MYVAGHWRPQVRLDEKIKWDIDFALGRVINIDRKYERAFSLRAPVSGLFIECVASSFLEMGAISVARYAVSGCFRSRSIA